MSTKLGSKTVGSSVYLKVNGTSKEFLVVHQGKPSSLYDDSCNGTWLLMKDIYTTKAWDSSNNDYENSDVHTYLNGTFLGLLESNIQAAVKQVKLPYRKGTGSGGSTKTGANGLSTKIFLLSGYECGWTTSDSSSFPVDGAKLDYFTASSSGNSKRIAYYNGSAALWWLRSPNTRNTNYVWYVSSDGGYSSYGSCYNALGVRPALVLDSSLSVSDDGSVQTNVAPTAPTSITVPSSVMGGSTITVEWGVATDSDGNLAGYKVERSTDGGSTWTQIYQGTATSTTNNVAFGTSSVIYRVKAYDDADEESAYKTSSQVPVVNNTAPSAPASISVPTDVKGGENLVISWTASTDTDDNLSGYKLERSVDGSTFTQVYDGASTSYTDTITKGWSKVQYRVKAYDPYAESGYTTSTERAVDNNSAPTITCSNASGSDLGTKSAGFSVTYSVNDVDTTDTVTVTEKLDGTVKRTYTATKEANNSFAVTGEYFQKVLNGSHTLTIEASDGKATATHTLTFTKSVTKAVITLETPMDADAEITVCAITVTGVISADADFTVEVTNNAKDTSPTWEDCTTQAQNGRNYLFTNKTAANGFSFNFRVTAERGASGANGYIASIQGGFQ